MSNDSSNSKIFPAFLGLIAIVALVVIIGFVLGRPAAGSVATVQQGTVATSATVFGPTAGTPVSQEQLTQAAVATILGAKNQISTEHAIALSAPPLPSPTAGPTSIGDDEYVKAQWSALGFVVENAWGGTVDGNNVVVFAGAWTGAPDQGVLQVIWKDRLLGRSTKGQFLTPGQHGSVHVTGGVGSRLTLVAVDGTSFYFDVPGLQFVSSLTEVVPTITPQPTATLELPIITPASTAYPIGSDTEVAP